MNDNAESLRFQILQFFLCNPEGTTDDLVKELAVSSATVKRRVKELVDEGLITLLNGKHRRVRLGTAPFLVSAYVGIEVNIAEFRSVAKELKEWEAPYKNENELLVYIVHTLPTTLECTRSVFVQGGGIIMGNPLAMIIKVVALNQKSLFHFVRNGIDMLDGITNSQTMVIDFQTSFLDRAHHQNKGDGEPSEGEF